MKRVKDLKEQGYVFLMMLGYNRIINRNHVKRLMKSVRDAGAFFTPIVYIKASKYFEIYPDRTIKLESGKVISKDSPDLDKILLILDGQHRYIADQELGMEEGYESTLKSMPVELPDGITPDEWMTAVNTSSRNWDERDRAIYINTLNQNEETNISLALEWRKRYGMGERACYMFLNFHDNYRKAYQVEYMRNPEKGLPLVLKGTEENRKRGKDTLHAVEVGFRKFPKALRNMNIVNFIVHKVYEPSPDENKAEIVKEVQQFFMTILEGDARKFATTSDKAEKENILIEAWQDFKENLKAYRHREEIEKNAKEAEEDWVRIQLEEAEKAEKKKK